IDLGLPDMGGIDVLKKVKAAWPSTGIIVLTGNASLDSAIEATNWGAFSYILKPYEIDLLMLNIRRAIEKQRTEEALRVSEKRLKLALATSQMGVWEWDPVTNNVYRSEETIAILGDRSVDWTLASFKGLLYADDAGSVIGAFERAVAEKAVYNVEYRIVRPDGQVRWISDIGRAEYDKEDRPIRMVGTVQDITDRKRAEQELIGRQEAVKTMAMQLSIAEERKRYRIAEDLNDQILPKLVLSKMRVNALRKLIPEGGGDDSIGSVKTLIGQTIADMRALIFQVRPPLLADAGLEAALKGLAQEFLDNYGLKVEVTDDESLKPLNYETRSAIFQTVRKLLLNVVKHAGTQNAWISIKKSGEMIDIKVEDNGSGADPSSFPSDKSRSGGYGLFNIKSRIEYLGGEVQIDSSPGSGTRVFITAPLDTTPAAEEQ
ncbi:MAG TPA: PAS domain-containing protein, partial [Geobacteraceae bacterium]|nr:PAS domain-containing protein [Geobacteraceae bacterium]